MSTPPVKTLIDEQIEDIERKLQIIGYVAAPDELASREFPIAMLPKQLEPTMKDGRVAVRVRP
ncbi:hypothetical protein SAMN04489802_2802 [Pseudomonas chlororaphis]|uniref:hypothetical protein n=1 Tax=Pseudomonas TaxID=286 RepID=UPI00087C3700|nr:MULTISPECIES: hypothetical protein [Pseudomonas]AZD67610.1 hypothetical protein C4K17_3724 [Pseudomonas chlororaphis subsp. aurantiaca]QIT23581.1 hypothetical protein HCN09_18225 [Pseudomonas chlororaphis subsp. aurantiaca]UUT22115.1 hypothetical protein NRG23_31245 [Pseudomonas sp. T8]WDH01675.1 hypothetical protein PUP57_19350 [Pseudomonas chlororaphis]WDH09477.1 hypothetical protein PUP64_27660 [Pseudomonas chlororaphis]